MTPSTRRLDRLEEGLGELLEAREGADLDAFEEYEDRPVAFAEEVLGVEPWDAQRRILRALTEEDQVLVRGGNAVGKDFAAACGALWWTFARRGLVLATAAVERQAVDVFMGRETGRLWRRAEELPGELRKRSLRIPGEPKVGVVAFTSTSASKLTGYHAPRVLGIMTEAQGLDDFAWEGMQASATGAEDRLLAVGNPILISGRFRELAESSSWTTIGVSTRDHPNVREGEQVIPGGPSPDFEERIARDWGRDSPVFVARVLGQFPSEEPDAMFSRARLKEAASEERWDELYPRHEPEPVVAVDVARHGADDTVMVVRRGQRIEAVVLGPGTAETTQTTKWLDMELRARGLSPWPEDREAAEEWKNWPREETPEEARQVLGTVRVDAVGVGAGVADQLREKGWRVEDFKASRKAEDEDKFRNRRAESYWTLKRLLEDEEIALPGDEGLFRELLAVRWSPDAQGRVALESKRDQASRLGGSSPDRADAVTMAVAPRPGSGSGGPSAMVFSVG